MRILGAIVEPTTDLLAIGVADLFHRRGIRAKPVTGANSRARTRTKFDAAGAKLSQKNHLQERQLLRTRGIAALAREFAPVTRAPRSAGPAKPPGGCASPRPLAN